MTNGATRNTKRITASLERSIVLEPTKKIQTGLLAIALGFGSAAFSLGGATTFGTDALAQTPAASAVLGVNSNAPSYPALVRSQELLLKARRSLMSRDVVAAERYVKEAQALNAQYGAASDRPEYVLPLVDQYKRAEAAARAQGMTEAVKRELAKSYLEQAEGLRRCQDLDAAENLVAEARKLNVVFDAATVERKMDVALTDEKGVDFQSNQTVRVCDQSANDIAVLFNTRYLGQVPNDASGRATLWNDIVKYFQEMERIRAVEDFDPDVLAVDVGDTKKAVLLTLNGLSVVNAMGQLYMSIILK